MENQDLWNRQNSTEALHPQPKKFGTLEGPCLLEVKTKKVLNA